MYTKFRVLYCLGYCWLCRPTKNSSVKRPCHSPQNKNSLSPEVLANLSNFVTPANPGSEPVPDLDPGCGAGVGTQTSSRLKSGTHTISLDSGFRRNDVTGLLQKAPPNIFKRNPTDFFMDRPSSYLISVHGFKYFWASIR